MTKSNILQKCLQKKDQNNAKKIKKERFNKKKARGIVYARPTKNQDFLIQAQNANEHQIIELQQQKPTNESLPKFWDFLMKDQKQANLQQATQFLQKESLKTISVMDLLNLKIKQLSNVEISWTNLIHYVSCIEFSNISLQSKFILANQKKACILKISAINDQSFQHCYVSSIEAFILENRESFMEEIALKQKKYVNQEGKLNEITKQLLYLCKCFRIVCSDLNNHLMRLKSNYNVQKINHLQDKENILQIFTQYKARLILKNIKRGIGNADSQFDVFNYFKIQDSIEGNTEQSILRIINIKQYKKFIKVRERKQSSRLFIRTACSVCFSNHYQLFNPLVICKNCFLRTHIHCYNLKNQSCGYCAYKKLSLIAKNQIPHCALCPQTKIMTIKIENNKFVHPFCLLLMSPYKNILQISTHLIDKKQQFYTQLFNLLKNEKIQQKKKIVNQKDYFQNMFQTNLMKQKSTFVIQNQTIQGEDLFELNKKYNQIIYPQIKTNKQHFCQKQDYKLHYLNQKCYSCKKTFQYDIKFKCKFCLRFYHSTCAYFEGCTIQGNEEKFQINCCVNNKQKEQWIRKFRLNINHHVRKVWKETLSFNYFDRKFKDTKQSIDF